MSAAAAGEAKLPEFCGGTVVAVDRLIRGIGVDLAGTVAVDRNRDVFDELTQSRLVVGGYAFARGPAFGLRPHSGTIPPPAVVSLPWLTLRW